MSLKEDVSKPFSGVFVSSRTLETAPASPPSSFSTMNSESSSNSSVEWKSSGAKDHQRNAPLFVQDPDHPEEIVTDKAEKLGMIMARSKQLPDTWYYSSNHVLVNQERTKRIMAPVSRMLVLDLIAQEHAQMMADAEEVDHLNLDALRIALEDYTYNRLGVNVQRGESIRDVHEKMMATLSNKNNICDRRFTHMGMGTALGKSGKLYMAQIFRG